MQSTQGKARGALLFLLLLLGGGAAAYWFFWRPQEAPQPVFHGNVDIRDVTFSFRVGGRVEAVYKQEGEDIQSGDVLAVLEKTPYVLALAQAQAAVDVANAQLKHVQAGTRREDVQRAQASRTEKRAAAKRASDTYRRIRRLEKAGGATTQSLIDARAAAKQSQAAWTAARARLAKLVRGARAEEVAIAQAQAAQAQAAVDVAALHLSDTVLHAKTSGVITTRAIEVGVLVQPGTPAFVVALENPVWIRAYAPLAQLGRLRPGTAVQVSSDARPGKPYTGRVGYVSPQAEFTPKHVETEEVRSTLVYRFRVIVEKHDGTLRQGMPVTVTLPKDVRRAAPPSPPPPPPPPAMPPPQSEKEAAP